MTSRERAEEFGVTALQASCCLSARLRPIWVVAAVNLLLGGTAAAVTVTGPQCSVNNVLPYWYVRAGADSSLADGTRELPLASIHQAVHCAPEGATIAVLPAPTTALHGGVQLKDRHRLIGVSEESRDTRPRISAAAGDAIVLANGNEVAALIIEVVGGAALVGDNVSGANLHDLTIIRDASSSISTWNLERCNPVVTNGQFDRLNSVVRGCNALFEPRQKGAVVFMADGKQGPNVIEHSVRNTTIDDGTEYVEGKLWDHGIGIQLAGDATATLTVEGVSISGTEHGISGRAYQDGSLTLRIKNTSVDGLLRDGIVLSVGFICSGLPSGVWYARDCSDRQWVPVSHAQVVLHADGYRYSDPQRRGLPDDASAIEILGYDQGSSEIEIHVQNSRLIGAAQPAVFNFNLYGYPARQLIDLGCRNPAPGDSSELDEDRAACERAGYTSPGGNRIYGNAWGGAWSSPLAEVALIGPGMMMAQGNFWGDRSPEDGVGDALGLCSRINLTDERVIRAVAAARCELWHVPERLAPDGIDGRFHLVEDPAR